MPRLQVVRIIPSKFDDTPDLVQAIWECDTQEQASAEITRCQTAVNHNFPIHYAIRELSQ